MGRGLRFGATRIAVAGFICGMAAALGAAEIDPALLAGMKARSIGPAGMSGRVAAIDAVESRSRHRLRRRGDRRRLEVDRTAASPGSRSSTTSRSPRSARSPSIQPNPAIVWVGTGEGNVRNSASVGNGVYRSLDGGETWTHLGLEATERIHRIVLHPDDPDVAWVAALGPRVGRERRARRLQDRPTAARAGARSSTSTRRPARADVA